MSNELETIRECLSQVNPAMLDYDEWLAVGMVCKDAGLPVDEWDAWSATDRKRHRKGEAKRKWNSFKRGGGVGVER